MLSLLHCSISVFLALYPWVTWQLSSLYENTQLSLPCSSFPYAALALICSQTLRGMFGPHGVSQ